MFLDFLYLVFFFLLGFSVLHWSHPDKINYNTHPVKVSIAFGLSALTVLIIYFQFIKAFLLSISPFSLILLVSFYIFTIGLYVFKNKPHRNFVQHLEKQHIYYASCNPVFILPMSLNILCQQLGIAILIGIFLHLHFSTLAIIIVFTLISLLSHLYFEIRRKRPIYFMFGAFATIAAPIFVSVLLFVPSGIIYTYIIHWSYYIAVGFLLQNKEIVRKLV